MGKMAFADNEREMAGTSSGTNFHSSKQSNAFLELPNKHHNALTLPPSASRPLLAGGPPARASPCTFYPEIGSMADLGAVRSAIPAEHRPICRVCTRNFSQYTCPRCNIRYCSLQCYKKHSVRCTEQFARENVLEEMKDMNATPESKQKMMEALQRIHFDEEGRSVFEDDYTQDLQGEEDEEPSVSGFDMDELLSEDTLQRLQEGRDVSFEDLSASEKKAFQRAVAAGKFNHMIEPWNPWWTHPLAHNVSLTKYGTQLVQPVEEQALTDRLVLDEDMLSEEALPAGSEIPSPPDTPLQAIKDLTSKQPSPLLGVHLTEVIYGYCFTLRLFNGDWDSDPLDAALVLLGIAKVLGDGASPESVGTALAGCLEAVCSPSFKHAGGFRLGSSLFDDTSLVLGLKREGLLCALADMNRLIGCALKDLKTDAKHKGTSSAKLQGVSSSTRLKADSSAKKGYSKHRSSDSRRLQTAQKKVYFMMCWVNEQISETFEDLVRLIQKEKGMMIVDTGTRELENISSNHEGKVKKAGKAEEAAPRTPLIQELG